MSLQKRISESIAKEREKKDLNAEFHEQMENQRILWLSECEEDTISLIRRIDENDLIYLLPDFPKVLHNLHNYKIIEESENREIGCQSSADKEKFHLFIQVMKFVWIKEDKEVSFESRIRFLLQLSEDMTFDEEEYFGDDLYNYEINILIHHKTELLSLVCALEDEQLLQLSYFLEDIITGEEDKLLLDVIRKRSEHSEKRVAERLDETIKEIELNLQKSNINLV